MKKGLLIIFSFFLILIPNSLFAEEYSLNELYRLALERSETIKIAEENLYISEREKDKVRSVLFPKLSAFAQHTRYSEDKQSPAGSVIQPENSASWGLRLEQSFSLSGRELTALQISKGNIERSRYDLHAVREEYLLSVASAYYDVLRAKKALEIAKANVGRLTKHRNAAAVSLKVGTVTKTALLRAEAELSSAQSEMTRAENNLVLAKAVLARVVGLSGDYEIKKLAAKGETVDYSLISLKRTAIGERAELKSLNLQKKIAENRVKYTKGAYWPALSIEGVYSGRDEDPSSAFFNEESIYVALKLNFPFFEGWLRRAEVREAGARQRQARLALEDLTKTISIEVEAAYLEFMTQKGVLKSLKDQLTYARDNYNAVSKRFKYGLASSIDVMDANTLLVTSEMELTNARFNFKLAVLKLKRATGTLLKTVVGQNEKNE